eukprot:COSAG06_NODE_1089_length_10747_cov_5.360913_5_plen_1771_part_00
MADKIVGGEWLAHALEKHRSPPVCTLDYTPGGPEHGTDPAHLLKDLRRLRKQEQEQRQAELDRVAATEARQAREAATAVADVSRTSDTPTVELARPWATWLTLPSKLTSLTDWALLRWLHKRGIAVPKDLRVYNASAEEWEKDDPPPNSKYMRLLTDREKARIRKMMEDWLAPRRERAMLSADSYVSVQGRNQTAWGTAGAGGWDSGDLVFSEAAGPASPEEDPDALMALAASEPVECNEREWKKLGEYLPEVGDDEQARKECERCKAAVNAQEALEQWIDRQAQSREQRLLLMARQRLTMARALRIYMEQTTRRSLKIWGYTVFPRSRSAWKCRAKIIIAAIIELYPRLAFAHHGIDPMDLDSDLCKRGHVEADQTAVTEAIKACNVSVVKRLLRNPDVRMHGKVPRQNYTYLHLAVLAARHVFDSDCEFWFSRPACLDIIQVVAAKGFGMKVDVYDESSIAGIKGVTPLQYAAFLWDEEVYRFLIKIGAKRDLCSGYQDQSVYHFAVRAGSACGEAPDCVKEWGDRVLKLMELREPTDWPANEDHVPDGLSFRRFVACLNETSDGKDTGDIDELEQEHKGLLINRGTGGGRVKSPFYVACSEHKLHLVKVLLEYGADSQKRAVSAPVEDDRGHLAKLAAGDNGQRLESPCAAALKYNWDTDTDGRKVVTYLIDNKLANAGEGLREGTASGWPFFLVALAQGMETIGMDDGDMPPGCIMHNEHLLESLLERKADINELARHDAKRSPFCSVEGESAFLLACGQLARILNPDANFQFDPDISLIEWLLDRNVKMTVPNRYGQTGLWVACRASCFECHCASQRQPDCVCGKGKEAARIVQYLVTHGAVLDQPDMNGITPFHAACIYGQIAIVRTLLTSTTADTSIPDFFGCFPRDSARMRGYHSIVELIDLKHPPTRVHYEGSMARGDPDVAAVAGPFIDSGMISVTHGDYAKAAVSFKVALAKIRDKKDVLASSKPDLCWMLAYIHFLSENRKRVFERSEESESKDEVHRWLHGRMIKQVQRAPVVEQFEQALRFQKTHLLTKQTWDLFCCKPKCGADDDELLKMILCNVPLHTLKNHLHAKATPSSFKGLYGRTLPTPLYLSIQYSTPEVFKLLLETTGEWVLGGPRPDKPAGPGGKFLEEVPEHPHYLYAWGAACGDKERSVAMHELHQWLPPRTPKQACELRLAHGWCPVTAGFNSVQMRKTCLDILKEYTQAREKTVVAPEVEASVDSSDGGGKKKRKSGSAKKKKKKKDGDSNSNGDESAADQESTFEAVQATLKNQEARCLRMLEQATEARKARHAAGIFDPDLDVEVDPEEMVPPSSNSPPQAVADADCADDSIEDAAAAAAVGAADEAEDDYGDEDDVDEPVPERDPLAAVPESVRAALARAGVSSLIIPSIEEPDCTSNLEEPDALSMQSQEETRGAENMDTTTTKKAEAEAEASPALAPEPEPSVAPAAVASAAPATPATAEATEPEPTPDEKIMETHINVLKNAHKRELEDKNAEIKQLQRRLEREKTEHDQEKQGKEAALREKLAAIEKQEEAEKAALASQEALSLEQRSAALKERLLVQRLVTARRALAAQMERNHLLVEKREAMEAATGEPNGNGSGTAGGGGGGGGGSVAESPAQPAPAPAAAAAAAGTKLTAAQRRQAKARQAAAAEAREDVEYLVRKHGNGGALLPISRLPALYAEEYGRHRPLSMPSWEESLKYLRTCYLITAADDDELAPGEDAAAAKSSASAGKGATDAAGGGGTPSGMEEGFVVWVGPE